MSLADIQFTGTEFWRPINDQQLTAMHSKAQMLMYGGGSGGGKTDFLVADAAQEYDNPNLRGLLIRRSYTEMENIIDRCRAIYSQLGATPQDGGKKWKFPSGAKIRLGYIDGTGDIGQYQGVPYTYLGIDESTYLLERSVRDILPWLASTDPSMFCRVRLGTNPGQVGADWHMHVFLHNKCPVHFPAESVIPGAVYKGSTWQDGAPTHMTTSFIPALVGQNPLYGQEKIDRLESQTAENREKLLLGCWCSLEGAYFKFLQPNFKIPSAISGEDWWHKHLIGVDYGYMGSWAAAGLYFVSEPSAEWPEGRMYQVGELAENNMGSEDFARLIGTSFIEPSINGHRREFEYAVFDPANDAQTGNGRSNFDIMREVLSEKYKVSCIKAAKGAGSRISNAQNLYRMLKTGPLDKPKEWQPGQLVITDAAPITFSSLCSRMYDPKHPGDVLKVASDKKDDLYDQLCYVAATWWDGSDKPKEVAMFEKLKAYKDAGMDVFSLNIHQAKMQSELSKPDAPVRFGHRRHPTINRRG